MNIEELQKSLEEIKTNYATLEKKFEDSEQKHTEELQKAEDRAVLAETLATLSKEDQEIFKSFSDEQKQEFIKADAETRMSALEDVRKAEAEPEDIPEKIQKRFSSLTEELKKQRKQTEESEKRNEELVKRIAKTERENRIKDFEKRAAEEIPAFSGDAQEKAIALMAVEDMPEGPRETIKKMLKAGDAAIAKNLVPVGSDGDVLDTPSDSSEAWKMIEKKAAELKSTDSSLTVEKAISKAMKDNPSLYARYIAG